jgi:iron-sulfur cluster repair protein YtfE (RIC family)
MLNQITSPRPVTTEDALDLLIGCHQRIRHFTETATKLAHAKSASAEEVRLAAAGVHRYYSVSLPLHEADEEDSLRPRLEALGDATISHALLAMHHQHMAIEELIERLSPLLLLLQRNPSALHDTGAEMCATAKALQEVFDAHLKLEEEIIFPAIRERLPLADQNAILAEMRSRRQQG